jgi:AcrR family transcriptional regulator
VPDPTTAEPTTAEPTTAEPTPTEPTAALHAGRPRDDAREGAILDATLVMLGEVGYERMTMDAIAAEARASKATIYRRWANKAQLVTDALARWGVPDMPYPDLGSLRDELRAFVARTSGFLSGRGSNIVLGLGVAVSNDPDLARALDQCFEDFVSSLDQVFARAVARGELPAIPDATVLFEVVPAVAITHGLKGVEPDEAWIDHVTDHIALPLIAYLPPTSAPPKEPHP